MLLVSKSGPIQTDEWPKQLPGWTHETIRWYEGPSPWTASKEAFDAEGMTYASNRDAFNTISRVYWKGKYVDVRCNDRGPNQIELTRGAFRTLEPLTTGILNDAIVFRRPSKQEEKDASEYFAREPARR
jgi:rare lipoprotein A (peptidoglycan hydrolase)